MALFCVKALSAGQEQKGPAWNSSATRHHTHQAGPALQLPWLWLWWEECSKGHGGGGGQGAQVSSLLGADK